MPWLMLAGFLGYLKWLAKESRLEREASQKNFSISLRDIVNGVGDKLDTVSERLTDHGKSIVESGERIKVMDLGLMGNNQRAEDRHDAQMVVIRNVEAKVERIYAGDFPPATEPERKPHKK